MVEATAADGVSPAKRERALGAWVFGSIFVLVVLASAWVGVRAGLAAMHLQSAERTASSLLGGGVDSALGASDEQLESFRTDAAAARDLTDDPITDLAGGLPWFGPQIGALAAVSEAVDTVAQQSLDALVELRQGWDPAALAPHDGQLDLAAYAALHAPAADAASGLSTAASIVDPIDVRPLHPFLAHQIGSVTAAIDGAAAAAVAASQATHLLPALLGADGPKDYLLLIQNNAELRSLGGIPGALALLHAEDGRLSLVDDGFAADFPQYDQSILPLADDVRSLYTDRPGQWMQNVTQIPDFSVGAQLAQAMWEKERGLRVDGVIAIDPVTLSYLLRATGPVTLPNGEALTADNAVPLLLNEVYFRYSDPQDQNLFFSGVTAQVFGALTNGSGDPVALAEAVGRAAAERRILLWSEDPVVENSIAGTPIAGGLPSDPGAAEFAVYLNDGTGSKMDYYLGADLATRWAACGAESTAEVTVTLHDTAPGPEALPDYITGGGASGVPVGVMRTLVYVYLPAGYQLVGVDAPAGASQSGGVHDGRRVVELSIDLESGQEAQAVVTARGPAADRLKAWMTPTLNETFTFEAPAEC